MNNNLTEHLVDASNEQDHSLDAVQSESASKRAWVSPRLKEFGSLSFVVKGISYNPLDGISNLTP